GLDGGLEASVGARADIGGCGHGEPWMRVDAKRRKLPRAHPPRHSECQRIPVPPPIGCAENRNCVDRLLRCSSVRYENELDAGA
ncbi:MAG TPA: hypothetical protein VE913_21895, partial [Longimicrobium sp.]|nr:hypothetical protein [Longimicrobium sp.]